MNQVSSTDRRTCISYGSPDPSTFQTLDPIPNCPAEENQTSEEETPAGEEPEPEPVTSYTPV